MGHKLVLIRDMTFGEKLEKLRDERGVSNREVARRLGLRSSTTVSNWIAGEGEPRLSQAVQAAKYFGVSLAYLADENEPPPVGLLEADERAILGFYRVLKRTRGIDVEEAMARLDAAPAARPQPPSETKVIGGKKRSEKSAG